MPNAMPPTPPAWKDLLREFEIELTSRKLSARTVSARSYHAKRFALAMPVPPERVTQLHVQSYLGKPNWKAVDTYNTVRQHVQAVLAFAQRRGAVGGDLVSLLPPPRRREAKITRAASQSAIEGALATANPRDRLMVILTAQAGLKPGEIAQLHSEQLDRGADGEWRLFARQTGGRRREILLHPEVAELIRAGGQGHLFPGKVDGHISPAYVSRLISRVLPNGVSSVQLRRAFEESLIRSSWKGQGNRAPRAERATLNAALFHPIVWEVARSLWESGHHSAAVRAVGPRINNELQTRVGRYDLSDTKLVEQAFSKDAAAPGKARLRVHRYVAPETAESMRAGTLAMGVACFKAIRNVTAHESGEMERQLALECLAAWSLFLRWVDEMRVESV